MAILKHLAIKKNDYGDIQRYLIFQCERGTHRPRRDEAGHMIPRDFYIQDGLNCDPTTFDMECAETNRAFGMNRKKGDIMAHHYILSFDPRDVEDHGLTPEKAHALAREFAEHFFAGHQALIVTHADGNNHTGNIHTHIVINSVRKYGVPWRDFMERPSDARAQYKHHLTDRLLHQMHERLYDICEREHLYTANIDRPAAAKVSDKEYYAGWRGERAQDIANAERIAAGRPPVLQLYVTVKQQLREAIEQAAERATNEAEFIARLREEHGIIATVHRGRYSYKHPEREKAFADKSLGESYRREHLFKRWQLEHMPVKADAAWYRDLPRIFLIQSDLRLVTDLQNCVKAQQSRAYARKVEISNLQEMARTVAWIQENGIDTLTELEKLRDNAESRCNQLFSELWQAESDLRELNQSIRHMGRYLSYKKINAQFEASGEDERFYQEHRGQLDDYYESLAFLCAEFPDARFPSIKDLKARKTALTEKRDTLRVERKPLLAQRRQLTIAVKNVHQILNMEPQRTQSRNRQLSL